MDAAIRFEAEGFLVGGERVVGRQVAGAGFLRAAVQAASGPLVGFGPRPQTESLFKAAVAAIDPQAEARWISEQRIDDLSACGVLYRPDPLLGVLAKRRLRQGPASHSLCGVTHTLCTQPTLQAIGDLVVDPVMPWDAVVCTSHAAQAVVRSMFEEQAALMRWRTQGPYAVEGPMTPVIPLGVHTEDFQMGAGGRDRARAQLGIAADVVVVLFAGRLSISGKAHPYPLLRALEIVAKTSRRPIALLLAGQPQDAAFAPVLRQAILDFAPSVASIEVDGRDADAYRRTWAAADIFISLADSVQETFGLTPLEAMAAGLPAIVSDWNGYKDTVRHGVDGFRVKTWSAPQSAGGPAALDYEVSGDARYSAFLLRANMGVAVEMSGVVEALRALADNPDLRARMGAAGRTRTQTRFAWSTIYAQYQALWSEQDAVRRRALATGPHRALAAAAPRATPAHRSPFEIFAGFPTAVLGPETRISKTPEATIAAYEALTAHPLIRLHFVRPQMVQRIFDALEDGPRSLAELSDALSIGIAGLGESIANLAKLDQVVLSDV